MTKDSIQADFDTWWRNEGRLAEKMHYFNYQEFCKFMCEIAWKNGAYKAIGLHKKEIFTHSVDFSVRTLNILNAEKIFTIAELTSFTERELLKAPNIGRRTLGEIKQVLAAIGLGLKA